MKATVFLDTESVNVEENPFHDLPFSINLKTLPTPLDGERKVVGTCPVDVRTDTRSVDETESRLVYTPYGSVDALDAPTQVADASGARSQWVRIRSTELGLFRDPEAPEDVNNVVILRSRFVPCFRDGP